MGASDECSHQEGNQVRGQLGITSFTPEILLSCGPAAEGAELGYGRLSPLYTTLEPYAPILVFCCIDSDIYRYERCMLRFYGPLLTNGVL